MHTRRPWILVAALAIPLALIQACDDDDSGSGPEASLLVEAVLDGDGGVVTVTDGGAAVTGANVSLNGTAATPGATDGEYTVDLPAPVTEGGALELEVSDGGGVVLGSAVLPAAPVITAPAQDDLLITGEAIEVTWTSASDPDRWVVEASDGTVIPFDVTDGAARAFSIPEDALTADTWEIRVIAINDGVVSGDAENGSTMEVAAAVASSPTVQVVVPLSVLGLAIDPDGGSLFVGREGVAVDGATVTVNGVAATQAGGPGSNYSVDLAPPVPAGGAINLEVTVGELHVEGTATIPEEPVVTAPTDGANIPVANPVQVDWTSTEDAGDHWVVQLYDGVTLHEMIVDNPAARSATFAAGVVPVGGPWTVTVYAFSIGELTGPAVGALGTRNENSVKPDFSVVP